MKTDKNSDKKEPQVHFRPPAPLKKKLERLARADKRSLNQWLVITLDELANQKLQEQGI
jgi:predicted HicB family RNase H-like nuclease